MADEWITLQPHLSPIWGLLQSPDVTEIMCNPDGKTYIERRGRIELVPDVVFPEVKKQTALQNIARLRGQDLTADSPILDARLPGGARLCAVAPPVSVDGFGFSIRRFPERPFTLDNLVEHGSLPATLAAQLREYVRRHANILIVGGTGSGKTTMLNALASEIGAGERIVTIEDTAEIRLTHPHVCRLEARRGKEAHRAVPIRDLLKASLRLNPTRIIIGELRGAEAWDFLQALNTGHSGTLSTIHANSTSSALKRLTNLVLQSDSGVPYESIRADIADSLNVLIYLSQLNGRRGVQEVTVLRDYRASTFYATRIYGAPDYTPIMTEGVLIEEDTNAD